MSGQAGGILLAAGQGRRLGRAKALVEVGGVRLVDRGIRLLSAAGCRPVVVVVGADARAVAAAIRAEGAAPGGAAPEGARMISNPEWRSGMGSSLRAGLDALRGHADAAVVALVDQPLVAAAAVRRLLAAWSSGARIAVATYAGQPRNPVLFDVSVWDEAARYAVGDRGARGLIHARPDLVTPVACDDVGAPVDIDTPADLAAVEAALQEDTSGAGAAHGPQRRSNHAT